MINLVFFIYLFTHPEQRLNLVWNWEINPFVMIISLVHLLMFHWLKRVEINLQNV